MISSRITTSHIVTALSSLSFFDVQIGLSLRALLDLDFDLDFAREWMPRHDLVPPNRDVRNFESTLLIRNRAVRVRHRQEEGSHEFVLVALEPEDGTLLAQHHRLVKLRTDLGQGDVEHRGGGGSKSFEGMGVVQDALD